MSRRIVVFAPHPDDEVLGVGGSIARFAAEGAEVQVVIVTRGFPPQFDEAVIEQGRAEAAEAHRLLGVAETAFLNFPAARLDTVPHHELNASIAGIVRRVKPDLVFAPFAGDIHLDHQCVFRSVMVAVRPSEPHVPTGVLAYETLSETNWNAPYLASQFVPNIFIDIGSYLPKKIAAMRLYASQIQRAPHERSAEALERLARLRGNTMGWEAAEGFVLVRGRVE